jgi:hypothetical protein
MALLYKHVQLNMLWEVSVVVTFCVQHKCARYQA